MSPSRCASTIATSTAQVVMMNANPSQLCYLFDLAHDFDQHMQTRFLLSLAPCVLTIGGALLYMASPAQRGLGNCELFRFIEWFCKHIFPAPAAVGFVLS